MKNSELSDTELLDAFGGVRIDQDNAAYYRGLLEQRLLLNRCDECATWHHPPRSVCPRCWSRSLTPTEVRGEGTIALLTILRQGPRSGGIDYERGHPLVAVELDEQPGLRISGTVLGAEPDQLHIGDRVRLVWRHVDGRGPRCDFELAS